VGRADRVMLCGAMSQEPRSRAGQSSRAALLARRGCSARLAAPRLSLAALAHAGELAVPAPAGTRVSLIALSERGRRVVCAALTYLLDHGTIAAPAASVSAIAVAVSPAAGHAARRQAGRDRRSQSWGGGDSARRSRWRRYAWLVWLAVIFVFAVILWRGFFIVSPVWAQVFVTTGRARR